jgi:hypothetical protein
MRTVDGYVLERGSVASASGGSPQAAGQIRGRGRWLLAVPLMFALASCGTDWAEVHGVTAQQKSDTSITVNYDTCWVSNDPMPKAKVVESATEVRIAPAVKARGSDSKACLSLETVTLTSPIGDRVVVDARTVKKLTVTFTG